MNNTYGRLIEDLPSRSEPDRGRIASARGMREFVAHLPLANPAQAAIELRGMLNTMLATCWPAGERIEALEALRVPVAGLCEGIEQQLGIESHPFPPAKEQLVETAAAFHGDLARNYALAVHELCAPDGKLHMFKGKAASLAVVRALVHLGMVLQWSYRLYRTPPAGAWRRLHALHRFAHEIQVADRTVADPLSGGGELDARQAYAHALLLALSDPYRFSSRELHDAWLLTRCLAPYCALGSADGAGIAVDENSDDGPGYVPEERALAHAGIFAMDLATLKRFIEENAALQPSGIERLVLHQRGGGDVEASVTFLHKLRSSWAGAAERGFVRLSAGHTLEAAVGLHALHFVLAGNSDFDGFIQRIHGTGIAYGSHEGPATWTAGGDSARPQVVSAQVLNQSLGGYRLQLPSDTGLLRMRIGEVIGLAPPAEEGEPLEWMVGLIRWLRMDNVGVFAGVELLARRAHAAAVRVSLGGERLDTPQRAVALPDVHSGDTSLLVSHLFDQNAAAVEVTMSADPTDWTSASRVNLHPVAAIAEIGPAYYGISIRSQDAGAEEHPEMSAPARVVPEH